jgi:hypothetical protein
MQSFVNIADQTRIVINIYLESLLDWQHLHIESYIDLLNISK